jgi:protein-S-isoprenylcysteine O-methyltransferase Ste14
MGRFLERGGAWVAGQGLLIAVLLVLAVRYPGSGPAIWRIAGVLVLVAAWAVAGAGTMAIGKNLTPFPKPADHAKLVQHGIYSRIRHPLIPDGEPDRIL